MSASFAKVSRAAANFTSTTLAAAVAISIASAHPAFSMKPGGGARRSTRAENSVFEIESVHFDQKERWIVLADFYTHPPKDLRAHLGSIHVSFSCLKADGVQLLEQVTLARTNALARHDLLVWACKRFFERELV